jgi:adenylate cyclase
VRNTINEYLEAMIDVADRHEAYVDKVVGDEVMLLFGAPIPDPEHAVKGLTVALEMIEAQDALWRKWSAAGRDPLHIGIGINTGEVIVGNVGTRTRMDYTVIGHHVNVAARLCSHAKPRQILLTDSTQKAVVESSSPVRDKVEFVEQGEIQAKGIREPMRVIAAQPVGLSPLEEAAPGAGEPR